MAERFGGTLELDVTTAAQRFYETHEDAYDYLVFFNNLGIPPAASAVAYESTVRNSRERIRRQAGGRGARIRLGARGCSRS